MHCGLDELRDVWRIADEAGFDHVWAFDHLNPIFSEVEGVVWEGWTLLTAMATLTRRVRIGLMVTGNTYRHPGLLAKMATTVDHLSGGRLEFGIGAGWAEEEHTMLGLEFPGVRERIERLDEACEVARLLWTGERVDFEGRYYRLENAVHNPPPVQRPGPPLWIGGGGERRTLRVVARHADVWNIIGGHIDDAVRKSEVLDRHCEEVGRDPGEIRRSVQCRFDGEVEGTLAILDDFVKAGFTEIVLTVSGPDAVAHADQAAEQVLPRLSG
jgi:F420-dependent oxidoreductase-like protein